MIPIIVDPSRLEIALVGRGKPLLTRLQWLQGGMPRRLTLYSDAPVAADCHSFPVVRRLPDVAALRGTDLVWITGLPDAEAQPLAHAAARAGALVNVEDVASLCDFHTPALVRRGDLVVSVSTGGRSPGLAARLRSWIEAQLGQEWGERLELLARKRTAWRRRPRPLPQLASLTDAVIEHRQWLPGKEAA